MNEKIDIILDILMHTALAGSLKVCFKAEATDQMKEFNTDYEFAVLNKTIDELTAMFAHDVKIYCSCHWRNFVVIDELNVMYNDRNKYEAVKQLGIQRAQRNGGDWYLGFTLSQSIPPRYWFKYDKMSGEWKPIEPIKIFY